MNMVGEVVWAGEFSSYRGIPVRADTRVKQEVNPNQIPECHWLRLVYFENDDSWLVEKRLGYDSLGVESWRLLSEGGLGEPPEECYLIPLVYERALTSIYEKLSRKGTKGRPKKENTTPKPKKSPSVMPQLIKSSK